MSMAQLPVAARRAPVPIDLTVAIVIALVVRVAFVLSTGRVWEDALITIAHARNAVEGLGLTHHHGEGPTHGFTSALSVLIPLIGEAVAADAGLLALRIASLVAVVVALVFAWRIAIHLELSTPARAIVLVFLAVEQNQIFYGMAGMETQVVVAILLAGFWHALQGNVVRAGMAAGLAVLARPEYVVLLVPFLALTLWTCVGPRPTARAMAVAALVVAPWVLFTVAYYGSPIPQTIVAKSATYAIFPEQGSPVGWFITQLGDHIEPTLRTFMPFLADTMVAAAPIPTAVAALVSGIVIVMIVIGAARTIGDRRWWGLLGFLVTYSAYRVIFLPTSYYDWYVPPIAAVGILVAAKGMDAFLRSDTPRWVLVAALSAAFILPLPWFFGMERTVQDVADGGVRTEIARYLGEHVLRDESVTSESAGYVGFKSRVTLWDFPGLTSPTALDAVTSLPRGRRSVSALVATAQPDWAVLRSSEYEVLAREWPAEAAQYSVCTTIGPGGEGFEVGGLVKRSFDLQFLILRRHPCPAD